MNILGLDIFDLLDGGSSEWECGVWVVGSIWVSRIWVGGSIRVGRVRVRSGGQSTDSGVSGSGQSVGGGVGSSRQSTDTGVVVAVGQGMGSGVPGGVIAMSVEELLSGFLVLDFFGHGDGGQSQQDEEALNDKTSVN